MAAQSVMVPRTLSSSALESRVGRVDVQRSPNLLAPEEGTGAASVGPWPFRRNTGTGWRLLGRDDAAFMPHRQAAVQAFENLHGGPGIAGAFRLRAATAGCAAGTSPCCHLATFLRCLKHRTCSRHNSGSSVRKAGSGCFGGTPKRRLKSREELVQHPVGFPDAAGSGQPEFGDQPVLKCSGPRAPRDPSPGATGRRSSGPLAPP